LKLFARALAVALACLAAVAGLMVLGVVLPRGGAAGFAPAGEGAGSHVVRLVANPIHTDIALEATPEILERFGFLARDGLPLAHPDLRTIVVGWGGRAFYTQTPTWADLTLNALWRSLTIDRSVLHVGLGGAIDDSVPGVRRVVLGDAAFEALVAFIEASFAPGGDGTPDVLPGVAYGPFDRFYEAQGRFNVLVGCNTWTAAALRAAGLRTGFWSPLPPNLLWGLDLHAG
jgi:uncharacterized protein (TIGR02117 family)